MLNQIVSIFLLLSLFSCSEPISTPASFIKSTNNYVFDEARNRQIPIQTYALSDSTQWNGELVILNAGYGSSNTEYAYISNEFAERGYYVVSIQHEIQSDEMLPSGDDIIKLRTPNWNEGVKSIERVLAFVKEKNVSISTRKVHLIGHSNGGDISVLYSLQNPEKVASLITLDHRRMPIPLTNNYKTLSIRADQFEADPNVIPSEKDQQKYDIDVLYLKHVDHNYLRDIATKETKECVISSIFQFLGNEKK